MDPQKVKDLKRAGAMLSIVVSITMLGIAAFSQSPSITGAAVASAGGTSFFSGPGFLAIVAVVLMIGAGIVLARVNRVE